MSESSESVYEQLKKRIGEGRPQPRLGAIQRVADLLGDPQDAAPVVHVTGTNGKSSTARMVEILLRSHGLRTGLFVSPHLTRFNERILIDGEAVGDRTLQNAWHDVEPILELVDAELEAAGDLRLTFFEAATALAFAIFADAPVDVLVLEVGVGGAWDATNIANATVAVFTPIALDHMDMLGGSIEEIAKTKAGIIKPGSVVISAAQSEPAAAALNARAAELGVAVSYEGQQFGLEQALNAVGGQQIDVRGLLGRYESLPLALHGTHQALNAAVAIAAVEALLAEDNPLNSEIIVDALSSVSSPGRFQRISQSPLVLVDAAHNPHGAKSLVETLITVYPDREVAFVIAALEDKDLEGIARELSVLSDQFFVTAPSSPRARTVEETANQIRDALPDAVVLERDALEDALDSLRDWAGAGENRVGVVTGSIALIGQAIAVADGANWGANL